MTNPDYKPLAVMSGRKVVRGSQYEAAEVNRLTCPWNAGGVRCGVHSNAQEPAELRNMFLNARDAEQDVRERQAGKNF